MKKRVISLLIALCLVVSLIPAAAAEAAVVPNAVDTVTVDGIIYQLYDTYAIVYDYEGEPTEVVLASEVEGLPVTGIDLAAFAGCESLTSVTIPEGITYIDSDAFYKTGLTQVDIPASVTSIGLRAFELCSDLTAINVAEGNEKFYSCDGVLYGYYTRYTGEKTHCLYQIPDAYRGVLRIPEGVDDFYDHDYRPTCTGLTEIYLPASLTYRPYFYHCSALTAIHADDGNELYYDIDGILYSHSATYDDNGDPVTYYSLCAVPPAYPGSDLVIPDGIKYISNYAIYNCANITDVLIPASVTSIGYNFSGCDRLTGIWVDEGNTVYVSDEYGVVFNREYTASEYTSSGEYIDVVYLERSVLYHFPTGLTGCYEVPDGVVHLNYNCFYGSNLNALILPATLKQIGYYAMCCPNLDWILFRGDLPEIKYSSLQNVTATVYYPADNETWTNVEDESFNDDADLEYIGYTAGNEPVPPYDMTQPKPYNPFNDVPAGSFYEAPVLWAVDQGITNGLSATEFGPTAVCNRAQVVTILWRAAGSPVPKTTTHNFVDVQKGSFYEKAVLWAVENGITTGTDTTHFSPNAACNRATVVTFLYRAAGSPAVENADNPFSDVPAKSWYTAPVLWAVDQGITKGLSATGFGPNASCNRAQVVTFLYRAYND